MKRILLLQLDGSQPNIALMRIAHYHNSLSDKVVFRLAPNLTSIQRQLGDSFDSVYASAIFERSRALCNEVLRIYPRAIVGGTGWDLNVTLEKFDIGQKLDYSIYPEYQHSIGFTQRGCRLRCEFCVVPRKEGGVTPGQTIHDIWRGDPYPRHILLLDNDFFGNPHWRDRVSELREGRFKVSFNQGINSRMISDEAAEALASLRFFDDQFKTRRLYTAWDNKQDEEVLFRGLDRLRKAKINPDHVMVYMLIGYWPGESDSDWLYRQKKIRDWGARPYPMPYNRNYLTVGFQRWVIGSYDKKISWADWKAANCRPEKLSQKIGKTPLPLFPSDQY